MWSDEIWRIEVRACRVHSFPHTTIPQQISSPLPSILTHRKLSLSYHINCPTMEIQFTFYIRYSLIIYHHRSLPSSIPNTVKLSLLFDSSKLSIPPNSELTSFLGHHLLYIYSSHDDYLGNHSFYDEKYLIWFSFFGGSG